MTDPFRIAEHALLLAAIGVVGIVVAEEIWFSLPALLLVYAIWQAIRWKVADRSRLAGGMAILLLSALVLSIGFITTWVVGVGLVLFAHGTLLSVTGAARLGE